MESTHEVLAYLVPSFQTSVTCLTTFQPVSKSTRIDNNIMVKDIDLSGNHALHTHNFTSC